MKSSRKYERFWETIRHLNLEELRLFFDSIDDCRRKPITQTICELGCRIGRCATQKRSVCGKEEKCYSLEKPPLLVGPEKASRGVLLEEALNPGYQFVRAKRFAK